MTGRRYTPRALVNADAMTREQWLAREAADPDCRPVTQDPIGLRALVIGNVDGSPINQGGRVLPLPAA